MKKITYVEPTMTVDESDTLIADIQTSGKTAILFTPCRRFGEPSYDGTFISPETIKKYFDGCSCNNTEFVSQAHALLASVEKSGLAKIEDVEVVFSVKDKSTLYKVEDEYGIYSSAKGLLEYHPSMVRTIR